MSRSRAPSSHSVKARSRSSSRAPGGARSHRPPRIESVRSPNATYAARARKKAHARARALESLREPSIDLHMVARKAMEEHGFEARFSLVVDAKANTQNEDTVKREGAALRDMRDLSWSSIGNYGAMGVDHIQHCERGQGGEIHVKVAIADVDAFVPKGSILDGRAQANATSIYAVVEAFPMLPGRLSWDLSSLPMEHDRLAIVVEFAVLPRGNVRPGKIYRAVVRNKAELAYDEVGAWLDGGERPEMMDEMPELEEQIRLQDEASLRLGKCRQGAPEAQGAAANGKTFGLFVADGNRAKRIIENFMIGASGAMSGFLEGANVPTIRRVVGTPKDWSGIVGLASAKGFGLPPAPDAIALSGFLEREKEADPEKFSELSLAIANLLGNGEYAVFGRNAPAECFCLAVAGHMVGTAPNQRYMDLAIQRLLKAALAHRASPYGKDELVELAKWCTDRENAARKVERTVKYAEA